MLRDKRSILSLSMLAIDLVITVVAFFTAYWLRVALPVPWFQEGGVYPLAVTMKALLLLLPLWWFLYYRMGQYHPVKILGRYTLPLLPAYRANLIGMAVAITIAYFLKLASVSRALVLLFFLVNCLLLTVWRLLLLSSRRLFARDLDRRHILVVGDAGKLPQQGMFERLREEWGVTVVETMERRDPVRLAAALGTMVIDDVIFTLGRTKLQDIEPDIMLCEERGVAIHIMTDWFKNRAGKVRMEDFFGLPVITLDSAKRRAWETVIKRAIDLVGAGLGLVVLSPLLAAIALVIKLTSPGPVIFSQVRSGLNGRLFQLYKFRSMVAGAEQLREKLEDQNEMSGPVFKLTNDPRLTPVGRFLRRASLDELPQLWNVVRGEISLVGPRPLPAYEIKKFKLNEQRRLSVLPGITCLWQISGRNDIDFTEWMKLDMQYIDSWSLWLDLKILLLTIPVVLLQKGAR
ncbi:MAG: sugar transferase [Candidatus Edwardsbacteria bacterium]|nr:sugar transferase [Candidatus Edwardsbacteria bacterium]